MSATGRRGATSLAKRALMITVIHAALVIPVLGLNIVTAYREDQTETLLSRLADILGILFWLPINGLIEKDRTDIFFLLIPFNSIVYGLLFAIPLHLCAKQRGRKTR